MNAKERILGKLRASLAGTTAVADDYDIGLVTDPWRYAADERIARLRRMLEAVHGETLLTTAAEWPQRVLEALTALDWVGQLAEEQGRHVLLVRLAHTPLSPLLQQCLLAQTPATQALWHHSHWHQLQVLAIILKST